MQFRYVCVFKYVFLPTAHNHTKRIIISEGACRAAHHSCPDVSGKYCTCEALNRLNPLATQINIHFFSEILPVFGDL